MDHRITLAVVLAASSALAWAAFAQEPPRACNSAEAYEVCSLKIQRNNALDELAIAYGARLRDGDRARSLAEYWKAYADGVLAQRQQAEALQSKAADTAKEFAARAAEAAKGHAR